MRIVQITPGSGDSFYCENCIRDEHLVKALRQAGHETLMVPLYLPLLDEGSIGPVAPTFFGGVNVYLQQKLALFRRTPRWIDRLFDSPGLLRWAARRAGMTTAHDLGATTLSMIDGDAGRQRKELHRLVNWLVRNDRPDIVSLSNILLIGLVGKLRQALGAPIVCWLQDEDEFVDALNQPQRGEVWDAIAARTADVDAFIAASEHFARFMSARLGIPQAKMHVVYGSMDWSVYEPADNPPSAPVIGYLSRMCRDKGLDLLIEALALLPPDASGNLVRLRAAGGWTDADAPFMEQVRRRIEELGLSGRVEILPNLSHAQRRDFFQSLSVLSVPERRGESGGLYVLESMAAGVSVVQPQNGVFPELLAATGGGLLFEPGDARSLADALGKALFDAPTAARLRRDGRNAVLDKFSAQAMAKQVERIYQDLRR